MIELRLQALDFATPAPRSTLDIMRSSGIDAVVRYLCDPTLASLNWKRLTEAERNDIHAAGLELLLVFQNENDAISYFTRDQGVSDGRHAAMLCESLGVPRWLPIFYAVDFGATNTQLRDVIVHYFNGVYDSQVAWAPDGRPRNPLGIYGGYEVCRVAQRHWRGVRYYWQTAAWSPRAQWGVNGAPIELPGIHVFQHDTGSFALPEVLDAYPHAVDFDVSYIHGWHPSGTAIAPHSHRGEVVVS